MNLVQDKVTIITGGTRGIGFAAAKIFIDNGAKVSIFGQTQEEVDTALAQLKELYPEEEVLGFAPDLTSRDAVMAAVGQVAQKHGRLDVMINNASLPAITYSQECQKKSLSTSWILMWQAYSTAHGPLTNA